MQIVLNRFYYRVLGSTINKVLPTEHFPGKLTKYITVAGDTCYENKGLLSRTDKDLENRTFRSKKNAKKYASKFGKVSMYKNKFTKQQMIEGVEND